MSSAPIARRRWPREGVIGTLVVAVLLTVAGGFFEAYVADENAALDELSDATALHRLLDETLRLSIDGETAERGFVLTQDPVFLGPLRTSHELLPGRLDLLSSLLAQKHDQVGARSLREAVESRARWTDEIVGLAASGDFAGARGRIATHEGMRRTDRVRSLTADIGAREDRHVAVLLRRLGRSRGRMQVAFVATLVIAIGLLALLGLGFRRDLRRLALMTEHAEDNERRFRALAESAGDLVRIHLRDGSMEYVSPSSERLLGYAPEEVIAMPPFALVPKEDQARMREVIDTMYRTGVAPDPIRHGMIRRDGAIRTFETRIDPAHGEFGVTRYHTIGRDVTERAREEERLNEMATKDAMTGLLNAGAFELHGTALIARCEAEGKHALMAFADVNGLKVINDQLGHDAGDSVIVDAAHLLQSSARTSDLVARVGGDEFIVLGIVRDELAAQTFSERLNERIQAHNERAGRAYRVSISVGTAVFMPNTGQTLEGLRAEADRMMYAHKRTHRGDRETGSGESLVRDDDGA